MRRHPPPAYVFPRAQHRRSLLSAASSYPDTYAASGPGPGTWKDPDPRRRSSRGSGGSEWACLRGNSGYATPAACPISTTSWRYGLRRTRRLAAGRSHRPRSAWSNQARLALLAVTHRYNGHLVFGSNNFRSPITCSYLHASAHEFQRPERPTMIIRWAAACSRTCSLCWVQQSVWDCRRLPTGRSRLGPWMASGLRGPRAFAAALPPDRCTG
jgi:hypothetical protein